MVESGALFGAILRVAHPELYQAARTAAKLAAQAHPKVRLALEQWPTVFHAVLLICNRETPYHRDVSGNPAWFDLLASLGTYGQATLALRNLGMQIAYTPGSVVLLSGMLIHHGVAKVKPDRICYAWYMSEVLHENFGMNNVPWMTTAAYHTC